MSLDQQALKRQVAVAAVQYILPLIHPDDIIGVGTGSTADLFIDALAEYKHRFRAAVASSKRSAERLKAHGIELVEMASLTQEMPVYVDGADEVNAKGQMIKGGGGALTQEKIVASAAKRFVCIVDESKWVKYLGAFKLPIEIIAMSQNQVIKQLKQLGATQVELREGFVTDNGHPILDASGFQIEDASQLESLINQIPGVVTCGFFAQKPATIVLMASQSGVKEYRI